MQDYYILLNICRYTSNFLFRLFVWYFRS